MDQPRLVDCCRGALKYSLSQFGKHLGGVLNWELVVLTNQLYTLHELHTLQTRIVVKILRKCLRYKNIIIHFMTLQSMEHWNIIFLQQSCLIQDAF